MKPFYFLAITLILSCKPDTGKVPKEPSTTETTTLTKTYIDPAEGYSQAVAVEANGIKTVYISGQVGEGESFEAQFRDALGKLIQTLENAGATFDDVVKYNTYIVDYNPEILPSFRAIRKEILGNTDMPASTLIGVEALGSPKWGVEIEAVAVLKIH